MSQSSIQLAPRLREYWSAFWHSGWGWMLFPVFSVGFLIWILGLPPSEHLIGLRRVCDGAVKTPHDHGDPLVDGAGGSAGEIWGSRGLHRRRPAVWTAFALLIQHWDITRLPYDGEADRWFQPAWLCGAEGSRTTEGDD
jgi:hypothetical protein